MKYNKVPADIEIALKNYKVAISNRKLLEIEMISKMRYHSQLIYECPSINAGLLAEEFGQVHKELLSALIIEYQCEDRLKALRKKHQYYE